MSHETRVIDHFAFVYTKRPQSYNATPKKKEFYKEELTSTYQKFFTGKLNDKELYAIVYYFYKEDLKLDADNISKPTWDALNNVGYTDDNQIKTRVAITIDLSKYDMIDVDLDNLPAEVADELMQSLADNDHTVYIEVGAIKKNSNIFNISQLWK